MEARMVQLRSYSFIDQMQPQFASFMATVSRGFLPNPLEAALFIEIAPGIDIQRLTDVALKTVDVMPADIVVERDFGLLFIHADDQGAVLRAGGAVLAAAGVEESQRLKPKVITDQLIRNVDSYQTQLVNRMRHGNMLLTGQTLYLLETDPAGYASLAANEAEKNADINILEVLTFGRYGRVYLGGEERDVMEGAAAAAAALRSVTGVSHERGSGD
jgi:hypothetical protein